MEFDIKVNSSDAKKGVDELGRSTDKLADSTDKLADSTEKLKDETDDLGSGLKKAGTDGKKGLKGLATGFKSLGTTIKTTLGPLALLAAAFAAIKEVMEKQQPVLDFFDTVFTSIGVAISQVSSNVSEAGEGFEGLTAVGKNLIKIFIAPLKVGFFAIKGAIVGAQLVWEKSFFGGNDKEKIAELEESLKDVGNSFIKVKDDAINAVVGIKDNIGEAITEIAAVGTAIGKLDKDAIVSSAKRTVALKNEAKIREAINRGIFEQYDREAELLRQQRDDTTLTIEARKKANTELGAVLKEQEKIMLQNANIVEQAAQAEFNANRTTENRVALIEAQNEKEAIRADITGRRSEQLINEIALEQERKEKEKEEKEAAIEIQLAEDEKEKERLDRIAEENEARLQREVEAQRWVSKAKQDITNSSIESAAGAVNVIASLDEENKALQAAAIVATNVAGIAKTVITTQASNAAIVAEGAALAIPSAGASVATAAGLVAANNVAAGISIAGSIAATAKGLAGLNKSGNAGSKPSLPNSANNSSATTSASAPSLNNETLFSTQNLQGEDPEILDSNTGQNQIKAYVVESEITDTQNDILDFKTASEIG
tara:strand:+ start:5667 stop:7466 length:1800 start_codon:yes stop_codon:yes gene_type:complete